MRLQLIACKVLQREVYLCAAGSKNTIDVVFMEQGLHNEPDRLREQVGKALQRTEDKKGRPYDATLLGYGLCSNGIVGLSAKIPVVVPRAHDCITILLGSKERYKQYFDTHRGVYWYSTGWIETGTQPGKQRCERLYADYCKKFGEDNAQYLMEAEQNWIKQYQWAIYVDWGFPNSDAEKIFTKECAEFLGWNYDQVKGDPSLLKRLMDGDWGNEDFLVVKPGRKICENVNNHGIIKTQ